MQKKETEDGDNGGIPLGPYKDVLFKENKEIEFLVDFILYAGRAKPHNMNRLAGEIAKKKTLDELLSLSNEFRLRFESAQRVAGWLKHWIEEGVIEREDTLRAVVETMKNRMKENQTIIDSKC